MARKRKKTGKWSDDSSKYRCQSSKWCLLLLG